MNPNILKLAKFIVDSYNDKKFDVLYKNVNEFISTYGKRMHIILEIISASETITFEESLLLARMYGILYKLSDSHFCQFSSSWLLSTWQNSYKKISNKEEEIKSLKVIYNGLIYSYLNNKPFRIRNYANPGTHKLAIYYNDYLRSRCIERQSPSPGFIYLLFYVTQKLIIYHSSIIDTVYFNQIKAGHIFGKLCYFLLQHGIKDYEAFQILITNFFEIITSESAQHYIYSDPEEDPLFLEYISENMLEECEFNMESHLIYQNISPESLDFLEFNER